MNKSMMSEKSAAAFGSMFSAADQKQKTVTQEKKPKTTKPQTQEKQEKPVKKTRAKEQENKKPVSFGCRISEDVLSKWTSYAKASGKKISAATEEALSEYMTNHRLTKEQKLLYNEKLEKKML